MTKSGVNISDIKENNRTLILKHICTNSGISRIELARVTGLTKMTLTNITNDLIKAGLIRESTEISEGAGQAISNSVGRKPIMLTISEDSPVAVGVWISRDYCAGVLTDLKANIIAESRIDFDEAETKDTLLKKVIECAKYLCERSERKVVGVGISSIGPVDVRKGMLLKPANFYGIADLNVCEEVSEALGGIPTYIEKDMDASALAERYFGNGRNTPNFIYVGITNGIGSGIISGGELFHGGSGFGGEFGHTSIDYKGELCHCKNRGCIEMYASVPNILNNYNKKYANRVKDLSELIELSESDGSAKEYIEDICEKLAIALASLSNVLDPSTIIIGHEGYYFSDGMLKIIEKRLNDYILVSGYKKIKVQRSDFEDGASIIGAATIVMDKIFNNELSVLS